MKNLESIFEENYKVNSININTNKKLGLFGLLQILQDIASEHALKLGFGYESSIEKGFFWVLTRQKLQMDTWPCLDDTITIKTWTKPVIDFYAIREYEIFLNHNKIGACSTSWMILDSKTRRPKKIENTESLFKPRKDYSLDFIAEKIILPKEIGATKMFEVRISDLDMNNHVNNVKYTQWVLDSIPFNYHKLFRVKEYEINFSAETFLDDKIEIHSNINNLESNSNHELFFKGNRLKDSKVVFTARMLTK
ncbi:thioesterase [Lutibacter sp. A80]|uniref:acyl-[acyl-carrier-protein] thioesterase n=1 Tax=Lutibacter sp. A80 TaxID=2918453 RepID=UPI001F054B53|nr:acyl-ACP thioesterase domain-containing protein [Lutibacter sp. A80]UMB60988.1 thioesterase [Lutibacter sp. A80]